MRTFEPPTSASSSSPTPRIPPRSSGWWVSSSSTTLFIVASKSGGTTETLSHLASSGTRCRTVQFIAITDPGRRSRRRRASAASGRCSSTLTTSAGGTRRSHTSAWCRPRSSARRSTRCSTGRKRCRPRPNATIPAAQSPGATLGAMMGESAWPPRQAHDRPARRDRELRQLGGTAHRGVDRQGRRHRARGRRIHSARPTSTDSIVSSSRSASTAAWTSSRTPGTLSSGCRTTAVSRSAVSSSAGRWPPRHRWVRARHQPVRPAERTGGQGRDQGDPRVRLDRGPGVRRPRRAAQTGGRGDYVAILAYLDRTSETERVRVAIRDHYRGADDRVRTAVPALDGTAPQGRCEQRRVHQVVDAERSFDLPIPGQPYSFER